MIYVIRFWGGKWEERFDSFSVDLGLIFQPGIPDAVSEFRLF
jgi:hypothetical protein